MRWIKAEDQDLDDLLTELDSVEEHLDRAIDAAETATRLANKFGGEIKRVVAGQLKSYLIPHLEDWVNDEGQAGSVASLKNFLERENGESEEDEDSVDLENENAETKEEDKPQI